MLAPSGDPPTPGCYKRLKCHHFPNHQWSLMYADGQGGNQGSQHHPTIGGAFMFQNRLVITCAACVLTMVCVSAARELNPVPKHVQREAAARKLAANARSDEAWKKALPVIHEWEANGKPYIPWAAKPEDLPQAEIPAFPGAQGGGMYSFGGRGGKGLVVTNLNDSGPGSFRA